MSGDCVGLARVPARRGAADAWHEFRQSWLATDDYTTLVRLGRQADRLSADPAIASRLVPVRVGLVSDATIGLILPGLRAGLVAAGLHPELHIGMYGEVTTALLNPASSLVRFAPQVVVVATSPLQLTGWPAPAASLADVGRAIDAACHHVLAPCEAFHARTGADLVINTLHEPPFRPLGNLGTRRPGDPVSFVRRLNLALADRAPTYVHLHDVAFLAHHYGVDRWLDQAYWFEAKQPVGFDCIAEYCRSLAAIVGALRGRARKVLVLDLDNTLWGGVVGDDGLGGLRIGPGSAVGEAYAVFQRYVRALKARGVLLAVCSKNDDAVARQPFTAHPDMVLRLDDFVAFKASWDLKSDALRAMAVELDLPLDAFVFVDDNPAERDEVRQVLPEVLVIEVPADPSGFVAALERARPFETVSLTREDLARTGAYQARRRSLDEQHASDPRAYLASLEMRASIAPFDEMSIERVTQLVNKTNQFNLTTVRVQPAEMRQLMTDPDAVTLAVRIADRHGDHGLIAVVFGHVQGRRLTIDAWLMSCRVLGRGVESFVFNHLLATARARGLEEIRGEYRPTDRNAMVAHHYEGLGFQRLDGTSNQWTIDPAVAVARETFISPALSHDLVPTE